MSSNGDTGQGATLTLETTGAIGRVRSIQLPEWVMEKIDSSALETIGFMNYIPGDLTDPGEMTIEAVFDNSLDVPQNGTVETGTVNFAISDPANSVAATLAGSGFITTTALPNLATNELMVLSITFAFDGFTGPAYTKESAT